VYPTDDAMSGHGRRLAPGSTPYLDAFKAMSMDERWLNRPPQEMLETFHWFRGEGFELIVEDLLAYPPGQGVIAEGFRLLPHLVRDVAVPGRAVWLLPTPGFRRAALESRGTLWDIPRRTTNPDAALRNLLERDALFTDYLRQETRRLNLTAIEVDSGTTEDDLTRQVADTFGL
jgi:hypothetical protein